MCATEDIFHAKCNHWSAKPRIYHKCSAAKDYPCSEKKTFSSAREDSLCEQCQNDPEKAFKFKGTYISVSRSNGRMVVKKGVRCSSKPALTLGAVDVKENESLPKGFLSGRVGL